MISGFLPPGHLFRLVLLGSGVVIYMGVVIYSTWSTVWGGGIRNSGLRIHSSGLESSDSGLGSASSGQEPLNPDTQSGVIVTSDSGLESGVV